MSTVGAESNSNLNSLSNLTNLRKRLKKQRATLSKTEQQALSRQAVSHLRRSRLFRSARNIAIYLPVRGEADPTSLRLCAHSYQRFYLPVLSPSSSQGLIFVEWSSTTRFRQNRFNIPEPLMASSPTLAPAKLDLVITPLLGFDHHGSRLGMGGGFYDRSFAFKRRRQPQTSPRLVGFAYQFQQVAQLDRQPWDVPLDAICTNTQLISF